MNLRSSYHGRLYNTITQVVIHIAEPVFDLSGNGVTGTLGSGTGFDSATRRFYYLTRLLNLQYLWYRPEKKCLELWGPFLGYTSP